MKIKLEKSTANDKRNHLRDAVSNTFKMAGDEYIYAWYEDHTEEYVYFETYQDGREYYWKAPYTYNGTIASIGEVESEVVKTTVWEDVVMEEDSTTEKKLFKWLDKYFGGSNKDQKLVIKQFNEVEMKEIGYLYSAPNELDGVGDYVDEEGNEQLVKAVNDAIKDGTLESNYFHSFNTDHFHFIKSWVNPTDCFIGETFVKQGASLVEVQYTNKAAYEKRVSGELTGWSIEGTCDTEIIEE